MCDALTVASYNIHRAVGGDRRKDPLRIAETIAALDADLIALQEVETPVRAAPLIFLQRLQELGYEARLGHTMQRGAHHYGNVLLSRLPVLSHHLVDISQPKREPRGLIDVRISLARRTPQAGANALRASDAPADAAPLVLRCLATHLGLSVSERRRQLDTIFSHLLDPTPGCCDLTVLMGDFNEWRRSSRRFAQIERLLQPASTPASFPSRWPLFALDRLWHGPGLELLDASVVSTVATRAASDHLPLRARLRLR